MPNIFKQAQQVNDHPKRNNFDLSKKINASFKFGTLYPVYCQPVVPGDSFSIDTAFNIKAMPVVFPVQTKMRAHMHYFYVRNKNLWKNWENWISNLPNATQSITPHPYVYRSDSEFKNGSIHDFLGVPTSAIGGVPYSVSFSLTQLDDHIVPWYGAPTLLSDELTDYLTFDGQQSHDYSLVNSLNVLDFGKPNDMSEDDFRRYVNRLVVPPLTFYDSVPDTVYLRFVANLQNSDIYLLSKTFSFNSIFSQTSILSLSDIKQDLIDWLNQLHSDHDTQELAETISLHPILLCYAKIHALPSSLSVSLGSASNDFVEYSSLGINLYSEHLHINALPYRAYESIYNAYYRNNVVDPLIVGNQVLYNKFIPNDGDGADSYHYELHQRNYELDFLTSALPSPQQGVAPMVGVTALGDITIEDENGITTARTESDEAGFVTKVVLTSPAASNDHARLLMNIAASGFNINDFRNTNALQRFLETSIRKGYKYKDFIAGHFGVEPKYVELDMPEFIGGFTRDVAVSTVVSNADTLGDNSGAALGEYGGFAQVVGGSRHSVRHYCDDYGFIMGILCITPTPCYSQLLPKHMIAPDNFLDYYFAEFSNIGMQPITYKEVAPIQSYLDSLLDPDKHLEDTFGYQRPNYDMVAAVDEVHGDFRGSLRNYVINRIFDHRPELGHDFIAVRPDEVNDIFVDTDPRDDVFIGEIGFAVSAKRPVPRVVIPNLGR